MPEDVPGAKELGIDSDGFFELEELPKKAVGLPCTVPFPEIFFPFLPFSIQHLAFASSILRLSLARATSPWRWPAS